MALYVFIDGKNQKIYILVGFVIISFPNGEVLPAAPCI